MTAASSSVLTQSLLDRCRERAPGYDRDNKFCLEDFNELKAAGYLKMAIPKEFGGLGMTLAQVARATRVSVGFLSSLERGQMRSSIATLRRIARFYRTNILSLFETAGEHPRLVRPAQRKILETTPDVRMELLAWGNTAMEPHLFRVKPGGGSGESYSHEGEEFLHILRGEFEIWLDRKEHYRLKPGDSLYFESSTPHRWRNPGRKETWLLWINTPPTF